MIRKFELKDMTECINMTERMHKETSYNIMSFDRGKVSELLRLTTKDDSFFCVLAFSAAEMIGIMLGKVFQHIFTTDLMAADLITYVVPERRGGITGVKFIKHFERWAEEKGVICVDLGVTSDIINDKVKRLYTAFEFKQIGFCFRKVL